MCGETFTPLWIDYFGDPLKGSRWALIASYDRGKINRFISMSRWILILKWIKQILGGDSNLKMIFKFSAFCMEKNWFLLALKNFEVSNSVEVFFKRCCSISFYPPHYYYYKNYFYYWPLLRKKFLSIIRGHCKATENNDSQKTLLLRRIFEEIFEWVELQSGRPLFKELWDDLCKKNSRWLRWRFLVVTQESYPVNSATV